MAPPDPLRIETFAREDLRSLSEFWEGSFPLHPMDEALLEERVFAPPDALAENLLCIRDADRGFAAIALLAGTRDEPDDRAGEGRSVRVGGIRWLGVHPDRRRRGLGRALMDESLRRLEARGAEVVDFVVTPPHYIRPGVDTRSTPTIAWLLRRGFEHRRTIFNMTLPLGAYRAPAAAEIFPADAEGYAVRRATPADEAAFAEFCRREWTEGWTTEGRIGLAKRPSSLFLATRAAGEGEEIVGFAVYEANQCLGCFGPTGVAPAHRGKRLGARLLYATLIDMKRLGRPACEIGWVGPVDFYHRTVGATLGAAYWSMRKRLRG